MWYCLTSCSPHPCNLLHILPLQTSITYPYDFNYSVFSRVIFLALYTLSKPYIMYTCILHMFMSNAVTLCLYCLCCKIISFAAGPKETKHISEVPTAISASIISFLICCFKPSATFLLIPKFYNLIKHFTNHDSCTLKFLLQGKAVTGGLVCQRHIHEDVTPASATATMFQLLLSGPRLPPCYL